MMHQRNTYLKIEKEMFWNTGMAIDKGQFQAVARLKRMHG